MNAYKTILAVESSCDETSAAVLTQENGRIHIVSNIIGSSSDMHAKYGGVIPEQAAREQLKIIIPVIEEALQIADLTIDKIDAFAVTEGPGLIGSLLVGVETMKVLATIYQKPLIPVNHLLGHLYANWINASNGLPVSGSWSKNKKTNSSQRLDTRNQQPNFPCIGLLVSGGHSDLVLFKNHMDYIYLGGTRDDAAGECFDKSARVLGFPYPGGPKISKLAQEGDPKQYPLPRPMLHSDDFDFSFSGLKTAFVNLIDERFSLDKGHFNKTTQSWQQKTLEEQLSLEDQKQINHVCASLEEAIIDVLVTKTVRAAKKYQVEQIIVAGGVAANQKLIETLKLRAAVSDVGVISPPSILCTDNAAMIAAAAFFLEPTKDPLDVQANPNLSLE